jgi:hypothetical protein
MGDLILADFQSKTYHKPQTQVVDNLTGGAQSPLEIVPKLQRELEKEAAKILESVPYEGKGIDGMDLGPERA